MRTLLCTLSIVLFALHAVGQDSLANFPQTILRQRAFGEKIPQEKVYVHLDNRCYFLGDTIWFKAYTQQTNDGKPSEISGTLYVELIDHDGYLKERKLVEMKNGQGHGFFATNFSTLYGGFYELRAYTRWQLNWGEYEHKHRAQTEKWFFNKAMSHEFFRDYEKLYSRTFPIFDKQQAPAAYFLDMSLRPLERPFLAKEAEATPTVTFFPEGGNLVEGLPCRVAYEAVMSNGEALDGVLMVDVDTIPVQNRGRGMFTLTPEADVLPKVVFVDTSGTRVKCTLTKVEKVGVTLRSDLEADRWVMRMQGKGETLPDTLFLTVMHQGVLSHAWMTRGKTFSVSVPTDSLPVGVNQATVSDEAGRVWADRLFFVGRNGMAEPTVNVEGRMEELAPYQPVTINVQAQQSDCTLSLAIRDGERQHGNFDNGSILTEMLLCSEIKGFVPQPDYFFEKDDAAHRSALDLLMMTQGWRRFEWKEMAVRGEFELLHPAETTPVLTGVTHKYRSLQKRDPIRYGTRYYEHALKFGMMDSLEYEMEKETMTERYSNLDSRGLRNRTYKLPKDLEWGLSIGAKEELKQRLIRDGEKLKREVRVHAEFHLEGCDSAAVGDVVTNKGRFRINIPRFYGNCTFHLGASDTTRWSREEKKHNFHLWILDNEGDYPEFYVRLSYPYPLFVKPFSMYQSSLNMTDQTAEDTLYFSSNATMLEQLNVNSRRKNILLKRMYQKPAMRLDAYDAFNMATDAGLIDGWYTSTGDLAIGIARYLCSDMGINERYHVIDQVGHQLDLQDQLFQIDGQNPTKAYKEYNYLYYLDSLYVFTSYSPRKEGDKRYAGADVPMVRVQFKRLDNFGMRKTYRDRYIQLPGYAYLADFYHPDYSTQHPSSENADYRRTLYWEPNLKLDAEGKAQVTFYNNARTKRLAIEAAGLATDGTLLWNKTE